MTTIGNLTLASVGRVQVRITAEDNAVEGLVKGLAISREYLPKTLMGPNLREAGWYVFATVTIGAITLEDLPIDTPCEVIA